MPDCNPDCNPDRSLDRGSGRDLETVVSSAMRSVTISRGRPLTLIGERINPTGRPRLMASLQAGEMDVVCRDALAQVDAGAAILDVNAGVPGADEPTLIVRMIEAIGAVTDVPLCIDSPNPATLEAALRAYQGKALVNSVNGEERSLGRVLPLVAEHYAAVIGLVMDDDGIPVTAQERLRVADKIVRRAEKLGIPRCDVILDPLTLTIGADPQAARVTLAACRLIADELGVNVTLGASNVSHGLPRREAINAAFLAMAAAHGLTCPITNPLDPAVRDAVMAANLLLGHDEWAAGWIGYYRSQFNK